VEKQERFYNILKLNKLFGISSIVFLLLLVWTFVDDYDRDWKDYQREFRQLEVASTKGQLDGELEKLNALEEYKEAQGNLDAAGNALKEKEDDLKILEKQLRKLEAEHYQVEQVYNFTKAEYDVVKYEHEEAVGRGHGNPEETGQKLDRYEIDLNQKRLIVEEAERHMFEKRDTIRSHREEVKEADTRLSQLRRQASILERKLSVVDPAAMSFANRIGDKVRDLPVLDFLSPYYKVDQVVLKDITEDINFMEIPKVDRCTTCHQGITEPGYEDASQPFTTHPDLALYLNNDSPHPLESFGCTSCHAGRGRGTDFSTAAHTPGSHEQEEEWIEKYDWHEMHHWEQPMFPVKYTEAGCFKCHSNEIYIRGADKLNLGTNLVERAGCFGCHTIERYKNKRRIGPDLNKISSKVNKDWTYLWIKNPKSFRHNSWMPDFFGLFNNSDPESVARTDQEINAIVHYLFKNSGDFPLDRIPRRGNSERGEDLVNSLGCLGCHRVESEAIEEATTLQTLRLDHGPNLIGLASKTEAEWIYSWLREPERYFPRTKMPNLRLSVTEAADITAYLMTMGNGDFLEQTVPPVDEDQIDEITMAFLTRMFSDYDSRQKLTEMTLEDKLDYTGEKLIRSYGCFGCHNIPGFEKEKPIGTELTEEGSKEVAKLDFGLLDIEHSRKAWFTQKLLHPRSFDENKVKGPYERLKMPDFEFSEQEVEAIVTAILGFVKTSYGVKPARSVNPDVHMGQWLVREYNCQGCHLIEHDGGVIRSTITQWLMDVNGIGHEAALEVTVDFSPPDLHTQGAKTQPDWLFDFFKEPTTLIRPNLRVRMPTFYFDDDEWNSVIKYFQFLDEEDNAYESPHRVDTKSVRFKAGKRLQEKDMGACFKCHFYGTEFPQQTPDTWAPNLVLTKERLRPAWVMEWLRDPQRIMPGTKMPEPYIPAADELLQDNAASIFGRELVSLKGDSLSMLWGLTDYLYALPGKTDITSEIKNFFAENGYQLLKQEEEEGDEWDEWEEEDEWED